VIKGVAVLAGAAFVVGCGGSSRPLDNAGISPEQMESVIEVLSEYCAEGAPKAEAKEPYGMFTTLVAGVKQKPDVMVGGAPAWQRLAGVAADLKECDREAYDNLVGADSGLEAEPEEMEEEAEREAEAGEVEGESEAEEESEAEGK
jgi:hypothetical protein